MMLLQLLMMMLMMLTLQSPDVERTVGINCRYLGALQNSDLSQQDRLFLIEVSILLCFVRLRIAFSSLAVVDALATTTTTTFSF